MDEFVGDYIFRQAKAPLKFIFHLWSYDLSVVIMLMLILWHAVVNAVPFRNRERITFDHLVSMKKPGETAIIKVLRDGVEHEFTILLRPVSVISYDHFFIVQISEETESFLCNFVALKIEKIERTSHIFAYLFLQLQPLVPVHQFDKLPSYYIFAGLVFVPLTQPYLHEYGEDWYNSSPRRLCERALRELPKKAGEQLVILSQVLFLEFISYCYVFEQFSI